MRVLHYTAKFSVQSETFIYDQINSLSQYLERNAVVTSQVLNLESRPYRDLHRIPLKRFLPFRVTQKLAFGLEYLPRFIDYSAWREKLNEINPDIVHCHMGNGAKTWLHVRKKLGVNTPTVISFHGSDVTMEPLIKKRYRQIFAEVALDPNIIWTVPSEFLKRKAIKHLSLQQEKVVVVNNAVNPVFCADRGFKEEYTSPKVLMVGRFIDCKGQEILLEAFGALIDEYPEATLTFVGSGPNQQLIKNRIESMGLKKAVKIIDRLSHNEIAQAMLSHNLYVQPSVKDINTQQEESFGVAALEALAIGLPVIVSDCGGLPEVAKASSECIVTPAGNVQELGKAIVSVFNKNYKLPLQSANNVRKNFSQGSNRNKILKLYSHLSHS